MSLSVLRPSIHLLQRPRTLTQVLTPPLEKMVAKAQKSNPDKGKPNNKTQRWRVTGEVSGVDGHHQLFSSYEHHLLPDNAIISDNVFMCFHEYLHAHNIEKQSRPKVWSLLI